jgi:hypothetical protein
MRASSLSDKGIIELLSRYYIPVWLSTDDHGLVAKDAAEQAEYVCYRKLAKAQGLSAGNVQAYLILPDGKLLTTLHVAEAAKADVLRPLLQRTVDDLKLEPRRPAESSGDKAASVRPRSRPTGKDAVEFHIGVRHLGPRGKWGLAEDWVEITSQECADFVPRKPEKGFAWDVPAATANKLYRYFFPPGPNYDAGNGAVEESSLTASVAAVEDGHALVLFHGNFKLHHRIGGKQTDGQIRARVSGYALIDSANRKLMELALVTDDADFVWHWEGKPQPSKFTAFVEFDAPAPK